MNDIIEQSMLIIVFIMSIFAVIILVYIVIGGIILHQPIFGQEWTYDMCLEEFDPITCDLMFPPLPLQSI